MGTKIHLNNRKKNVEKLKDRIKVNALNKVDDYFTEVMFNTSARCKEWKLKAVISFLYFLCRRRWNHCSP